MLDFLFPVDLVPLVRTFGWRRPRLREHPAKPKVVCSQNRIRSKSAWGHSDLPQKPMFSWSERYLGNQSRTRPAAGTSDTGPF
jgi:hypothetical protein